MSLRPVAVAVAQPSVLDDRLRAVLSVGAKRARDAATPEQIEEHQKVVEQAVMDAKAKYSGQNWIVAKSVGKEEAMINGGGDIEFETEFIYPKDKHGLLVFESNHLLQIRIGKDTPVEANFIVNMSGFEDEFDGVAKKIFPTRTYTPAQLLKGKTMVENGELAKLVKLSQANKRWKVLRGNDKMSYRISETAGRNIAGKVKELAKIVDESIKKKGKFNAKLFVHNVPESSEQLAQAMIDLALAELHITK